MIFFFEIIVAFDTYMFENKTLFYITFANIAPFDTYIVFNFYCNSLFIQYN